MPIQRTIFAAVAALACLLLVNDVMAQGRGGFDFNSKLQYLRNSEVRTELELVPEQEEDLKGLEDDARNVMREVFSGMREKFRDLSAEEREDMMAEVRTKMAEGMKDIEKELSSIMLPHQLERLDQIVLQARIRREGTAGAFKSKELMEKLGLTEEEAEKLAEKEKEVKEKLDEKIKKLRAEAQDEILSVLPAEKQKTLKTMIGDSFEMSRDAGRGRGGRGDRGGRGGRGGRGQGGGGRGGF